jgi:hypothetical protein
MDVERIVYLTPLTEEATIVKNAAGAGYENNRMHHARFWHVDRATTSGTREHPLSGGQSQLDLLSRVLPAVLITRSYENHRPVHETDFCCMVHTLPSV